MKNFTPIGFVFVLYFEVFRYYSEKIQYLIDQPDVAKQISRTNYEYANEHFMASAIAQKIEKDIKTFVNV
jgi:hypothetical protein